MDSYSRQAGWPSSGDSPMRSSLRDLLQYAIVRTSFFPLTLLYGTAYALSVRAAAALLSRIDGVAAIYLRRGLAKG